VETTDTVTVPSGSTDYTQERDWTKVPVGLPFTEMQQQSSQFQVTTLTDEMQTVRQTWMQTAQYEKLDYQLEPVEVKVTETVMRDVQVEVMETVLEDYEVEVVVSVMHEVRGCSGLAVHESYSVLLPSSLALPPHLSPARTRLARSGP